MTQLLHDICNTIEAVARHIASKTDFGIVENVSNNAWRLAEAVGEYSCCEAPFQILLIDDVLITSEVMEAAKAAQPVQVHPSDVVGYVIFATHELPTWCNTMFALGD
jgi:hypothetical protein